MDTQRIDAAKSIWIGSIIKIEKRNVELFLKEFLISQYYNVDLDDAQKYKNIIHSTIVNKEKGFALVEFIEEKFKMFFIEKKEIQLSNNIFLPIKHYRQKQTQSSYKKRSRYESNCSPNYDSNQRNEDMFENEDYGSVSRKRDRYNVHQYPSSYNPYHTVPTPYLNCNDGQLSFLYPTTTVPVFHPYNQTSPSFYGSGIAYRKNK
jgi:hypothetical protein